MARARNIKPGFFKNEILGVADPLYSLLFEGLWVLADRSGRLEDRPLRIKGEVFPYRDGLNVDAMLNWLESNGFIRRYTAQGKKCILVLEFVKHQNPHKNETESELPAPSDERTQPEEIGTVTEIIGSTRADSLSSDSLIPDSLSSDSLIPDSLIPDTPILNSVPIATGGAAAKSPAELTKDELWKAGKSLLEQSGMPKAQCGSFVGKLVKDYGDVIVVDAVRSAVLARPADPVEYLKATCMRTAGQRAPVNKQEALEQRNRSVADAWAAEGADHAAV